MKGRRLSEASGLTYWVVPPRTSTNALSNCEWDEFSSAEGPLTFEYLASVGL